MTQPRITIFTKPNCPYCERAKRILQSYSYTERDVTHPRNADATLYFSGVGTVPQIFIGDYHINGADDLERLYATGRLSYLIDTVQNATLTIDSASDKALKEGAEDQTLRTIINRQDSSRSNDPEIWPLLHFSKDFFGFWPNTYDYLNQWPEIFKMFVYCHYIPAIDCGKQNLGMSDMLAVGYATSEAHGCSYCQVHSVAANGEKSLGVGEQLRQAKEGNSDDDNPYDDLSVAVTDLAAKATLNQITRDFLDRTVEKLQALSTASTTAYDYVEAVEMMVANLGFLNVFNDLIGTEIEGDWAKQAEEQSGIEAGRHAVQEKKPSNLDYVLPTGGPSMLEMMTKYDKAIEDLAGYANRNFGLMPDWISLWPTALQKRQAFFYGEVMCNGDRTPISAELKHLMARVSAIAKNHGYLSAVEGFMAYHTSSVKPIAIDKVRHCFAVATGKKSPKGLFTDREDAALKFAWLSAQVPLKTPSKFIQPAISLYTGKELAYLSIVCALASSLQRFSAIAKPEIEPEVFQFMEKHQLVSNTLRLRYPEPCKRFSELEKAIA
ncbi:MAG: glutaredoxin domain-containing protein [Cyanobacteria bacterium J06634_6]